MVKGKVVVFGSGFGTRSGFGVQLLRSSQAFQVGLGDLWEGVGRFAKVLTGQQRKVFRQQLK